MEKEEQSVLFSRDITVQVGTGQSHAQNRFTIPVTSSLCAWRLSQNNMLAIIVKGLSCLGLGKNCQVIKLPCLKVKT